jgi:predicted HicB family RNase H-like nuclease
VVLRTTTPKAVWKETSAVLTQSQEKYREVLQVAENLYRQTPDWVTFFREVLGIDGAIRKRFPSFEALTTFEKSEEFDKIQKMLVKLREKRTASDPETEPTRVITVRLPKSMHEYLRTEAHDLRTSMNKLCISKLLQVIGEDMIPNERTGPGEGGTATPATNHGPTNHAPQPIHKPQIAAATLSQPTTTSTFGTTTHSPAPSPFKPATPRF